MNKQKKSTNFNAYLEDKLKDKNTKKHFDEFGKQLELAYQILQLRKSHKMSQRDLAEKIGTTQSNVARMEGGRENFTVAFLNKVALALDMDLKIVFK